MADVTSTAAEKKGDFPSEARRWMAEIQRAQKAKDYSTWLDLGRKVVRRYRDEREGNDGTRFNILWSNTEVLEPALYSRVPKVQVDRRFLESDEIGKLAAQVLERALGYSIDAPGYDFDGVLTACVQDHCLPGLGQAKIRYIPHFKKDEGKEGSKKEGKVDPPEGEVSDVGAKPAPSAKPTAGAKGGADSEPEDDGPGKLVYEEVRADYVYWQDVVWEPARRWEDCNWLAYKVLMSRAALKRRFNDKADDVKMDYREESGTEGRLVTGIFKRAVIWEIWDKEEQKVRWLAESSADEFLDEKGLDDGILDLTGFFPSPKPLLAVTTNDTLVPIPIYYQYQDQARELDNLSERIGLLTSALRVVGVYDSSMESLKSLLNNAAQNDMIPVDSWASFAEKGGLKGRTDWLPLEQVVSVLTSLYEARDAAKQTLYEISGMSDIIRGASDPNETARAQEIKSRFGSLRLSKAQGRVQAFARDLLRLMGEVIAERFQQSTLQAITGFSKTSEPAIWTEAEVRQAALPLKQQMQQLQAQAMQMQQQQAMAQAQAMMAAQQAAMAQQMQGPPTNGVGPQMAEGPMPPLPPPQAIPQQAQQQQQQAQQAQPAAGEAQGQGGPPPDPMAQLQAAAKALQKQIDELEAKPTWEAVVKLLRDNSLRGFRIDVETDSTIQADQDAEKAARVEFLTAMGGFLQQALPLVQQVPEMGPLVGEMLMFAVRGFKAGRQLEEAFDDAISKMKEAAESPQAEKPDPKMVEAEAKAKEAEARIGVHQAKAGEIQAKAQSEGQRAQIEGMSAQSEAQLKGQKLQAEMAKLQMELQALGAKLQQEQQLGMAKAAGSEADAQSEREKRDAEIKLIYARIEEAMARVALAQQQQAHEQGMDVAAHLHERDISERQHELTEAGQEHSQRLAEKGLQVKAKQQGAKK